MILSFDLLFEAVLFGILLGCFYAAVSIGLSVSFGLLDVPHVAHPALMVFGSYCTFVVAGWGLDPILAGVVLMPAFFVLGILIYRFYYETFERRGSEAGVRGLAFFFGLAFIIEVGLILAFGVDQRVVQAAYIGSSLSLGDYRIPYRMLVAFGVALVLLIGFSRLYLGVHYPTDVLAGFLAAPLWLVFVGAAYAAWLSIRGLRTAEFRRKNR